MPFVITPEYARQLQDDYRAGKKPNPIMPAQRRILDRFRPTQAQINAAFAKAREKAEGE